MFLSNTSNDTYSSLTVSCSPTHKIGTQIIFADGEYIKYEEAF